MATTLPHELYMPSGSCLASDIHEGEPYEVSHGERIECASTGGRGAGAVHFGSSVIGWDPAVTEVGIDAGYTPAPDMLRAPDIAVGNVPNKPGWIPGVPQLAVEYADVGQDEKALERKIKDLLEAGTKYLWVVRLTGLKRVEVYEPGKAMEVHFPGRDLQAPGVLKNPIPVEAMYDAEAAEKATLRNILGRYGYKSILGIRNEALLKGREEGLEEGIEQGIEQGIETTLRQTIRDMVQLLNLPWESSKEEAIAGMKQSELNEIRKHLLEHRAWPHTTLEYAEKPK